MDASSEDSRSETNDFDAKILATDDKIKNDERKVGNCYW